MDRNLVASQVATASPDKAAYGELYQWGRRADSHQCRTSLTTSSLSITGKPSHGDFILVSALPNDWPSLQNDNLWQSANDANNPYPIRYRIPTEASRLRYKKVFAFWSTNSRANGYSVKCIKD